jgi:hypothetical protein
MVCTPIPASADIVNRGTEGAPLFEIRPAPKSIYPDQAAITAEPAPSDVNQAYLGPVLLMKSAIVDLEAGTATLPLRRGKLASGETVWLILTDTTDVNLARLNGVPFSSLAIREASLPHKRFVLFDCIDLLADAGCRSSVRFRTK